jgi:23S rRNA pseudouridine2605 synthase
MSEERLQKILAHAGVASRRAAEALITAGRVRVNGRVITELGAKANPHKDRVELDGTRLVAESPVYIVLHKPRGVVSTMSDPEGRLTVKDFLKEISARVYPVGRLDYATSGVLLVTNDGEFSDGLLHPKREVPKSYVVKVAGTMGIEDFLLWSKGVELDDGPTKPAKVTLLRFEGDKTWMELTIKEGRNQQVRRMGEATGFPVMRLVRSTFAGISSDGLKPGSWRHLTRDELNTLKKTYGVPKSLQATAAETPAQVPRGNRGRVAGVDARGRGRGKPLERAQPERADGRGRGTSDDRAVPERAATRGRGRAKTEDRAVPERGKGSATDTRSPRYGGGSPGRRGYDVKTDWGGGAERGRTRSEGPSERGPSRGGASGERGASRGGGGRQGANGGVGRGSSSGRGESRSEGPDKAAPGGRGRATRTTGTGGGIGASEEGAGYRMARGRKR